MPIQLIIAAIIAAMGFAGGFGAAWKIQAGNINAKEAAYAKQELANVKQAATAAIRNRDTVIDAQNRANTRSIALRRDAESARTELARLRSATTSTVQAARADPVTCPDRAAALGDVLTELGRAGGELAEKADRHVSDLRTVRQQTTGSPDQ